MDPENSSRAGLALPNPQESSSAPEIELSEVSLRENPLLEKAASSPPCHTWLVFLKRELEFLGITQILVGLICLCFGTIVCSVINISELKEDIFSSFKAGYPFWGAVFFAISGFLPIMSEKKHTVYLVWGTLSANTVSTIAAGIGIFILTVNLKKSSAFIYNCQEAYGEDFCFMACFSTEIVAMILFLTILGFCSAVSLIIYGVGEVVQGNKITEDRLYEELNIYSPIYSELEDKVEASSPADSTKDRVHTPEGAAAWFGSNPPQKNVIQLDQTANLKTFLKGEPQTLGVAQILIGLMKCAYLLWFFVSGAVSIAAGRNMTLNLIKGSLGVNILSAVIEGMGIIMSTVELTVRVFATARLVSLLEVSIALSLSVFGCKVTCFVTQVVVIQPTNDKASSVMAPYEHIYEDLEF